MVVSVALILALICFYMSGIAGWYIAGIRVQNGGRCKSSISRRLPLGAKPQSQGLTNMRNMLSMSKSVDLVVNKAKKPHILVVIPDHEAPSYFYTKPDRQAVPWTEVFQKLSSKLVYEKLNAKYMVLEEDITMEIKAVNELLTDDSVQIEAPITLLVALQSLSEAHFARLRAITSKASVVSAYNCSVQISESLQEYGQFNPQASKVTQWLLDQANKVFKTQRIQHKAAYTIALDMWERRSVEDLLFMLFVLLDSFTSYKISSVQSVTSTESTGLKQIACMCKNCAKEIADCMKDETCRKALDCLNNCKGNDQVCSYRCITSHETPAFEAFAKCILQRNNCMGNKATMPVYPDPSPLTHFRGKELDFDTAENIFIGHLSLPSNETNPLLSTSPLPWSWKVVCGQNPAYDYFACQHQIFYRNDRNPSLLWYDPVFRVTTIYGEDVWRRRHYRVRRGQAAGQFYFSVSDNGVVSNEFWRILDCAEDLSWAVFYYSGAASAAGTSYSGSLLITPDGKWPVMTEETRKRIDGALERGQIANWELFQVDNSCCDSDDPAKKPPLGIPYVKQEKYSTSSL